MLYMFASQAGAKTPKGTPTPLPKQSHTYTSFSLLKHLLSFSLRDKQYYELNHSFIHGSILSTTTAVILFSGQFYKALQYQTVVSNADDEQLGENQNRSESVGKHTYGTN